MKRSSDYARKRLSQVAERLQGLIYPERLPLIELLVSGPTDQERIPYEAAQQLTDWRPAKLGDQFGPAWATFWFRAKAQVPEAWKGKRVDLQWVTHSEGTLWLNGRSEQGLNWTYGKRPDAVLLKSATGDETLDFQIEMACNHKFGAQSPGWRPTGDKIANVSPYVLDQAEIAVFDPEAWELYYDFYVLQQLEAELTKEKGTAMMPFAGELLFELNRFANVFDHTDRSTWAEGRAILKPLYERKNATVTHELSAIGHAHIDTAWLWPLAETDRKCVRTFSSQTTYMQDYPDFKFSCSQAYQYDRIKTLNPELYDRIKTFVKTGQFIPVGGTWIEPDCNIPSGESLCRQFLLGQRFFEKEFGIRCKEFWNPDVFGYNGQLPQIMNQAGIKRFLTQKLSWNWYNRPEHHTFIWQGLDGSEVLAHFPPADTYNAVAEVWELVKNAREYKDHDRGRESLLLFGWGDGGGGPTKHMLEILKRAKDLEGLPRTEIRSSDAFFDRLEKDIKQPHTMIGELYFELHRGTYTSQAAKKRGNRKSEFLLHDIEFLATLALTEKGMLYPAAEIEELWKLVCLNQFHDILPGSSIALVYDDAKRQYAEVESRGTALRDAAVSALIGAESSVGDPGIVPINTIGFAREEVVTLPTGELAYVSAPSYGIGRIEEATDDVAISELGEEGVMLENAFLRATLSPSGQLVSLIEKTTDRETMAGAGDFKMYEDYPTAWDAWDVEPQMQETERPTPPADAVKITAQHPLRGEVQFTRKIGRRSTIIQTVRLDANSRKLHCLCDVDWNEEKKMLKVAFPVNVRAMNATYEMQFGTVERPAHFNTSHDEARFEVPGHKWSDLSEHGFGVALLSESKYGFSTFGNTMRMTLLRATKYPDPGADIGQHHFEFALMPHAGGWREAGVVAEAFRFNAPLVLKEGSAPARCIAGIDDANLVLDTIKRAEDSDAIIVRLYETHGARGLARLRVDFPFQHAMTCNLLEEAKMPLTLDEDGLIEIPYTPHQLISIKLLR